MRLPSQADDFSCETAENSKLVQRFPFNNPAAVNREVVSGQQTTLYGNVNTVNTDSDEQYYAEFNEGFVGMQPFTLEPGDDITFTFWLKPDMTAGSGLVRAVFGIMTNTQHLSIANGRIQFTHHGDHRDDSRFYLGPVKGNSWSAFAGTTKNGPNLDFPFNPHLPTNDAAWPAGTEAGGTWSFVAWRIRVSDGFQSVSVNGNVIEEGIRQTVPYKTYSGGDNRIGLVWPDKYLGGMSDFRMYKTYLSDEKLAAVQKGEPACSGPPPGKVFRKRKTKVNARMSIPLTVEEFDEGAQLEYRETVAAVVGVTADQVTKTLNGPKP
jgi:hypothetical protein